MTDSYPGPSTSRSDPLRYVGSALPRRLLRAAISASGALIISFLLISCGTPTSSGQPDIGDSWRHITVFHDDQRGVTCWALNGTALDCMPDKEWRSQ